MKLLCPVDFSEASDSALRYACALANSWPEASVEIIHCLARAASGDGGDASILGEGEAQDRLQHLAASIAATYPDFWVSKALFRGDPVDVIAAYAAGMEHDLIVVGTKGLSRQRELTFGSVTEELLHQISRPLLVVPVGKEFEQVDLIVAAVDGDLYRADHPLHLLFPLLQQCKANLHLLHVAQGDRAAEAAPEMTATLSQHVQHFEIVRTTNGIGEAINRYCAQQAASWLCMIHRDRGWMLNAFHRSAVKRQLFHLQIPLVILQD